MAASETRSVVWNTIDGHLIDDINSFVTSDALIESTAESHGDRATPKNLFILECINNIYEVKKKKFDF